METKDWVAYICAGAGLLAGLIAVMPSRAQKAAGVTALVLFLAAGVVAVAVPSHSSSSSSGGRGGMPTPDPTGDTPAPARSAGATTPPSDVIGDDSSSDTSLADGIDWEGDVRLSDNLNLDATPIQSSGWTWDIDMEVPAFQMKFEAQVSYITQGSAAWTSSGQPSKSDCDDHVRAMGDPPGTVYSDFHKGGGLCVITNDGNDAFLRVKDVEKDSVIFHAVRWQ